VVVAEKAVGVDAVAEAAVGAVDDAAGEAVVAAAVGAVDDAVVAAGVAVGAVDDAAGIAVVAAAVAGVLVVATAVAVQKDYDSKTWCTGCKCTGEDC